MKIPNADRAVVDADKLVGYLLSTEHPVGRFKARFFLALGFTTENWQKLRDRLLELAFLDAEPESETEYGRKYRVSGPLQGPKDTAEVVVIWIIRARGDAPRLVTVYPR